MPQTDVEKRVDSGCYAPFPFVGCLSEWYGVERGGVVGIDGVGNDGVIIGYFAGDGVGGSGLRVDNDCRLRLCTELFRCAA